MSIDIQYAAGEEQSYNFTKTEEAKPKQKLSSVVNVLGGESQLNAIKKNTAQDLKY